MAIVINGSGTVTGLAVGGLPDGTVDSDTLASGIDKTSISDSGDATAITIDSSENVGIGVTPNSGWTATNSKALQMGTQGSLWGNNGGSKGIAVSDNMYWDNANMRYITTDEASQHYQSAGTHYFRVASSGTADSAISWTTAMTIDNAGIVTKPAQPAFQVDKNADQTLTVNSEDTVTWEDEVFDVGSNFASNTFTAPVTGKYFLQAQARIDSFDTAATYYRWSIETSNQIRHQIIEPEFAVDLSYYTMSVSGVFQLDAGDIANVKARQVAGTASHIDDTISYTNFCGYLLG